jgi:hypothetical protein
MEQAEDWINCVDVFAPPYCFVTARKAAHFLAIPKPIRL